MQADDEEGTWFYTRMALMLAAWQAHRSEVVEILGHDGILLFVSGLGDLVVPLYVDYGVWSAASVAFFDTVERAVPPDRAGAPRVLWIAGSVSPRVRQELGARGWRIVTDVSAQYLADHDRALWQPGEAPEDRILPEIGGGQR